ncbi:MAG: hypothetical protein IPM07_12540 [Anaerolineales bacterium]|nr:hypothetical protein [Anaerolineales bacterium]
MSAPALTRRRSANSTSCTWIALTPISITAGQCSRRRRPDARTFYRALDKLDTYEDRGLPFSAWLFRIAHNLVAMASRPQSPPGVFIG